MSANLNQGAQHGAASIVDRDSREDALHLTQLSAAQRRIAQFHSGVLLIDAGPGSGKTKTIAARCEELLRRGVDLSRILCLAFTNYSRAELRDRIHLVTGVVPLVETYHSFATKILSEYGKDHSFRVLDETQQFEAFRRAANRIGEKQPARVAALRSAVSYAKSHGQPTPAEFEPTPNMNLQFAERVQDAWRQYELWCQSGQELDSQDEGDQRRTGNRWLDFDDLLLEADDILRQDAELRAHLHNELRHIMVDEFQDSNQVQYRIVRMIAENRAVTGRGGACELSTWTDRSFVVIGDNDQAIYKFRGGMTELILGFQLDYPQAQVFPLGENYRSSGNIVLAAASVITNNRQRTAKPLVPTKPAGLPVRLTAARSAEQEAEAVADRCAKLWQRDQGAKSIAILTRNNATLDLLQHALNSKNVVASRDGLSIGRAPEIGFITDLFALATDPHNDAALYDILIGRAREELTTAKRQAKQAGISLWEALKPSTNEHVRQLRQTVASIYDARKEGRVALAFDLAFSFTQWIPKLFADPSPKSQDKLRALTMVIQGIESRDQAGRLSLLNDLHAVFDETHHPVRLLTTHGAKGLEWDYVFICGADEERWTIKNPDDTEEERRLFYVAMTRARRGLFLSFLFDRPVRFIDEVSERHACYEEL